jgi:ABC-type antimicrobial peptide transport system permease subunit
VRATLAWEATTLAVVGLLVGLPAGIILGRLAWSAVSHNLGIGTDVVLPVLALGLVVPSTLLLVNLVAYVPARAAAKTRAVAALAAE